MKKIKKLTKKRELKQLRTLKNKAYKLWAEVVKLVYGNKCCALGCNVTERLNAHHIESKELCPALRFDVRNGVACCPRHHKFGKDSFHKSLCFAVSCLSDEDLEYLSCHRNDICVPSVTYYNKVIRELEERREQLVIARNNYSATVAER